jgi:hypothetical protein
MPSYKVLLIFLFAQMFPLLELPNEILLMIFVELQPIYTPIIDDFWTQSTLAFPTQKYYNPKTLEILDLQSGMWNKRYHKTVHTSYKNQPILLLLSHICQQFRRVAHMHPMFSSLQLYRFLAKPKPTSICIRPIMQLSMWIRTMSATVQETRRLRTVVLDPILGNQKMLAEDCVLILKKIANPDAVLDLVLMLGWLALGDKKLTQEICRFRNVQRLYLKGGIEDDVLHGFDNKAVKLFSKSFTKLTHLFIDGFGRGSFSWNALKLLLKANPNIKVLALGYVRDGILLDELAALVPNLRVLSIQFCDIVGHSSSLFPSREIVPDIQGTLHDLPWLESVHFHQPPLIEADTHEIVQRLIQGTPFEA